MTISSTVSRVDVPGNGSATTFSFSPAVITQASDLDVWLLDNAGNQSLLTQGTGPTQYTVVVASYPGTGSITYPGSGGTTLATGWKLTIKQRAPLLQQFQPMNQGAFLASSYGQAYDYATLNHQNLQEQITRSILAAETDTGSLTLPTQASRVNQLLGFDGSGNLICAQPSSALVSVALQPIVNSSTTGAALNLLTVNAFAQTTTGHFWLSAGGRINRITDRVLIGGATANAGNASGAGDWLNGYQAAYPLDPMNLAQLGVLSDNSDGSCEVAIMGGVRSLNHTSATQSTIGVAGFAYNNNATLGTGGWSFYGESYRLNDTVARQYGAELCVINQSSATHLMNPYSVPTGASICLQLDSGNSFGVAQQTGLSPSSGAMLIVQNTNDSSSPFKTGICLLAGAVAVNTNGFSEALSLPAISGIQWYTPGTSPASFINCTTTNVTQAGQILLENAGIALTSGAANSPIALFQASSTSAVNFFAFNSQAAGTSPSMSVAGSDTDIALVLTPKGAGAVTAVGNVRPDGDNTRTCGVNGARWSAVWAANGTIQTSDPSLKTAIAPLPAALPMIAAINPITFRWLDGGSKQVAKQVEVDQPVYEEYQDIANEHQVQPDGTVHLVETPITRRRQLFTSVPVTLPDGTPVIDQVPLNRKFYRPDGSVAKGEIVYRADPRIHQVPVMQKVTVTQYDLVSQPGVRTHWGFSAADVKAATPAGMDWGAYVKGEDGTEHIRPDQLIPVLWKAVQELAAEIATLKGKLP